MANVIPSPKEIAEAAKITLEVVDHLVGYAKELQSLFARAVSMPRLALLDLEKIFTEIDKALTAVDEAIKVFFDAIQRPEEFIDNDNLLFDMSGPRLAKIVEDKRGHCHEIDNIYKRYLSGILSKLFEDKNDSQRIESILQELSRGDRDLFEYLGSVSANMRELSRQAYRVKLTGKRQEAIDLISSGSLTLLDMRDKLNDASITIRQIENEFIRASRTAPITAPI